MIFYLASYPRSGNSWIRRLLRNQFRYMDSPIHGDPGPQREHFLDEEWSMEGYFRLLDYPPAAADQPFAHYACQQCEDAPRLLLMPGSWRRLESRDFRRELAARMEIVFIKSHFHPYEDYFPGEGIIQPVRHPGASLWSYYNFLKDVRGRAVTLEDVIEGKEGFGCWSRYHARWNEAAKTLNGHLLRVHYEHLFGNELSFCQQLSRFTGLPLLDTELMPFSYYQNRLPKVARRGRVEEWAEHYTGNQMRQLRERHGEQMLQLGYR